MKKRLSILTIIIAIVITNTIASCTYPINAEVSKKHLYFIYVNNKYGFIDDKGKVIVEPKYDFIKNNNFQPKFEDVFSYCFFSNGEEAVRLNKKWGLIDVHGNLLIKCQYDEICPFNDTSYIVSLNKKVSVIDKNGKSIIPFGKYDAIRGIVNGYSFVSKKNRCGYVDKNGKEKIPLKFWRNEYNTPGDFYEGLASVYTSHDMSGNVHDLAYIDTSGKVVIKTKYDLGGDFSCGLTWLKAGKKFDYINKDGKVLFSVNYGDLYGYGYDFKSGYLIFRSTNDGIDDFPKGVMDIKGKQIVKPVYNVIERNNAGHFLCVDCNWNPVLLDSSGNVIYRWNYSCYQDEDDEFNLKFSEGKIPVIMTSDSFGAPTRGFVDMEDNKIIPAKVDAVYLYNLSEGVARYKSPEEKYGVVDANGNEVTKPIYDNLLDCHDGLIRFEVQENGNTVMGYMDKTGKTIFDTRSYFNTSVQNK